MGGLAVASPPADEVSSSSIRSARSSHAWLLSIAGDCLFWLRTAGDWRRLAEIAGEGSSGATAGAATLLSTAGDAGAASAPSVLSAGGGAQPPDGSSCISSPGSRAQRSASAARDCVEPAGGGAGRVGGLLFLALRRTLD